MTIEDGAVFDINGSQAVRLPAETRFASNVRKVAVRVRGVERILAPVDSTWDSFFLTSEGVTEDFLPERSEERRQYAQRGD